MLQDEIVTQEESMESFYRRATEIQTLLQSSEPPLELQVQCEYLNTFAFVFNSSGVPTYQV